jgi:hypothetical protein
MQRGVARARSFVLLELAFPRLRIIIFDFHRIGLKLIGIARQFLVPLLFEVVIEIVVEVIIIEIFERITRHLSPLTRL